eukprot:TRINITY_DN16940_c0_g1_i1.p1 TRINITY_DN16940_c0_g1~~TRINITY_DN16940_c0_g1_i1.p1  ORF type:complete len:689 (+),score=63.27 TRINITY_DN16940_c0_g1_i1:489-2555(+)
MVAVSCGSPVVSTTMTARAVNLSFQMLLIIAILAGPVAGRNLNNYRVRLDQAKPSWAKASALVRDAPLAHPIHVSIHLEWRNSRQLESFALAVSDPSSATFGKFLEPEEFFDKYSPLDADLQNAEDWLTSHGFALVTKARSKKFLIAEGTVGDAAKAFNTRFGLYKVNGRLLRAPKSTPSMPAFLGSAVVLGLNERSARLKPRAIRRPTRQNLTENEMGASSTANPSGRMQSAAISPKATKATLCYWEAAASRGGISTKPSCGYDPSQIRAVYGAPATAIGTGVTIAVIDAYASPFMQKDLILWSNQRGIKPSLLTQVFPPYNYSNVALNAAPEYSPGWQTEEALDIEVIHGIAPGAKIVYLGSATPVLTDILAALSYAVDNKLASLISNSYGWILDPVSVTPAKKQQADNKAFSDVFVQAAVLGIGIYYASGDNGDESTSTDMYGDLITKGLPVTDYPPADPWVTAVGGTSLGINSKNQRVFESYWGSWVSASVVRPFGSYLYGGGGGISQVYSLPKYQSSNAQVRSFLATYGNGTMGRVVPDISANADPATGFATGYSTIQRMALTYEDYTTDLFSGPVFNPLDVIGGTSLSCPMMVAFIACAQQMRKHRKPYGFINPILYKLPSTAFFDILPNSSPIYLEDEDEGFQERVLLGKAQRSMPLARGFDAATGLGVPTSTFFAKLIHV